MMNKRGQVTIFIIVGIVIVISVFLIFYFLGDTLKRQSTPEVVLEESSLEPITNLIEECVSNEIVKGVELVGLQGGYNNPPVYFQIGDYKLSYDCDKDESGIYINRLPTLNRISSEIEEYTSDNMNLIEECIDNFKTYKDQGYKINDGDMNINVEISDSILVDVNYPVEVNRGDFTSSFNNFEFSIPSGLINAYKVATDIVNDECTGTIFNIDDYIINNPPLSFIERQLSSDGKLFYYLTTIPQNGEDAYRFHFIVKR